MDGERDGLKRGTQIIYVPAHADGNTWHHDCERGFVTSVSNNGAFCRYWSKVSLGELRTKSNSELTPIERLVVKDTVAKAEVERQLAEIAVQEGEREGLKPRPGRKVAVTVGRRRVEGQLLHPERPGYPDGAWIVLFGDGMADVFRHAEMEAAE